MKSMKIVTLTWVTLTWMAATLLLAQDKDTKSSKDADKKQSQNASKSDASKGASSADPVSSVIPKGATQVEPNLYRFTDAQGKTWFYRRFPFGVSKWEDKPAEQVAKEEPLAGVVRDLGDSVEFQRRTPFGMSKWVSKKTDLNDEEKELFATYEAKRIGAPNTGKPGDVGKAPPADKSTTGKQEKE
jgi:hypothetical protein